jgi:hypothetical protein
VQVVRSVALLTGVLVVSACASASTVQNVQSNTTVQQTEKKIEAQVSRCMPTANGAPDPLLLRRQAERAKFMSCTGVAKNARSFDKCAFKVLLGGLPTVARLKKGLTGCVQQNA